MTIKTNWSLAKIDMPFKGISTQRIDQGNMTIVQYNMEGNAVFPYHRHPEEQVVIILGGSCKMRTEAITLELSVGDVIYTGPLEPHGITANDDGVTFLNIITPQRKENFLEFLESSS